MGRLTRWNEQSEMAELVGWDTEEWKNFMNNFDVPIWASLAEAFDKLAEYEDLEEQDRMIKLDVKDIHPCINCNVGWGSLSSVGYDSCENHCVKLEKYNAKYNK